ncbi:phosphatase PAP2 family protein [Streptomyces sp. NPDC046261]|uniref:phosphatase PAP2 family protein n=1 Tax=Streptomyces sp. NPDC046261 TaxID=3157200 RepID=UPI003410DB16
MAGLVTGDSMPTAGGESNPDVSLLYEINGIARSAPNWADRTMEFIGEYGIVFGLAVLMLCAWWSVRKTADAPAGVAALLWAPLAAGIALLVNIPIRDFVRRPRPFLDHPGLEVLVDGKKDYSFVSDHATLTMALAVGLFVANRKYGFIGIGLALLEGFCRVYMGVHYPTDVVGGLALGTAVALLLAPLAMMLLTPLTRMIAVSRAGRLVRSSDAPLPVVPAAGDQALPGQQSFHHDRDLAA